MEGASKAEALTTLTRSLRRLSTNRSTASKSICCACASDSSGSGPEDFEVIEYIEPPSSLMTKPTSARDRYTLRDCCCSCSLGTSSNVKMV